MESQGASVVITHHIVKDKIELYDNWLNKIGPICKQFIGNMDWQIIRPIPNLTYNYTVIVRFDTIEHLKDWMNSKERKDLISEVQPLLAKGDKYYIKSGLDFLFLSADNTPKPPVRWKQYLVTWSAIYPLSMAVPLVLLPLLKALGLPDNRFINSFCVSGLVVFIMVYLLMPYYTKLIKHWLYK